MVSSKEHAGLGLRTEPNDTFPRCTHADSNRGPWKVESTCCRPGPPLQICEIQLTKLVRLSAWSARTKNSVASKWSKCLTSRQIVADVCKARHLSQRSLAPVQRSKIFAEIAGRSHCYPGLPLHQAIARTLDHGPREVCARSCPAPQKRSCQSLG